MLRQGRGAECGWKAGARFWPEPPIVLHERRVCLVERRRSRWRCLAAGTGGLMVDDSVGPTGDGKSVGVPRGDGVTLTVAVTRVESRGVDETASSQPKASGWAAAAFSRAVGAALDAAADTARGAVGAARSTAMTAWSLTLHVGQWLVWTALAVASAAAVIVANGMLNSQGSPSPHLWIGAGLLALVVTTQFPPLLFRFPRGWKRVPYIILLPAIIGVLISFGLGLDPSDQPSGLHPPAPQQATAAEVHEPSSPALSAVSSSIPVPSDPRATYTLVSRSWLSNGNLEVVTKRVGPSGTGYSRREINCSEMTFRYTAEGDTLADLNRPYESGAMGPLVPESISTYVARHACP